MHKKYFAHSYKYGVLLKYALKICNKKLNENHERKRYCRDSSSKIMYEIIIMLLCYIHVLRGIYIIT